MGLLIRSGLGAHWNGSNFLHLLTDFRKPFVSIYSDWKDHQLAGLVFAGSEVFSHSTTLRRPAILIQVQLFILFWGLKVLLLCTKGNTIHTSAIFVAAHTISHKYTLGTKPEEKRAWNFNKNPLACTAWLADRYILDSKEDHISHCPYRQQRNLWSTNRI